VCPVCFPLMAPGDDARTSYTPIGGSVERGSDRTLQAKENEGAAETAREEHFDLAADTYDFFALRLLEFFSKSSKDTTQYLHLLHAFTLWSFNLFLQGCIVLVVWKGSDELEAPWSDAAWQDSFGMTLQEAGQTLLDAVKTGSEIKLDKSADLLKKCKVQTGISTDLIYYVMICIWLVNQFKEFKRCRDWWKCLWEVSPMTEERTTILDEEKKTVQCMPIWLKTLCFFVVPFVKFVVFLPTTFVGFKFLALQLVLSIDELLISALALRTASKRINVIKIRHMEQDDNCGIKYWYDGVGGLAYLTVICGLTFAGLEIYYGGLMFFRRSCRSYDAFLGQQAQSSSLNITKLFSEILT